MSMNRVLQNIRLTTLSKYDFLQLFTEFIEFHGDRISGDDSAIVTGIAYLKDMPVTVLITNKGKNPIEWGKTHYGEPMPQGYRKVLRMAKQAEKFHRPIVSFINVSGAFPGALAEQKGQATAIAQNLLELGHIKVPFISVFYGEGGSGGALALACGDETWMLKQSMYTVVSPEGFSSILWRNKNHISEAVDLLQMLPDDLVKVGVANRVLDIDVNNFQTRKTDLISQLYTEICKLKAMPTDLLLKQREEHYDQF
ncbi:carboxyl transferase domain-containing protein [Latilactobacillus sakei]|uniref:carboxyl transferase domain-containing protein n=1 Tax=Latilactobacillus sakei TaxID=1599 RepID=UPI002030C1F8|nr:carboxyl transferase domain-containing protein [Latilactobacillus sakei]MCM1635776.1 acetyl-CoA carboxylase carboxyl transferase subunit alpha [Latilactobacillus sakei]